MTLALRPVILVSSNRSDGFLVMIVINIILYILLLYIFQNYYQSLNIHIIICIYILLNNNTIKTIIY